MKEFLYTHEYIFRIFAIAGTILLIGGCIFFVTLAGHVYGLLRDKFHMWKEIRKRQENCNNQYNAFYTNKELEDKITRTSKYVEDIYSTNNSLSDRINELDLNTDHRLLNMGAEINSIKKQQLILASVINRINKQELVDPEVKSPAPEVKRGRGRPKKQ